MTVSPTMLRIIGAAILMFNLCAPGVVHADVQGVPQDDRKAFAWYQKAADQGYAIAQSNLGVMYDDGRGVAQDRQKACALWREAAAKGEQNAVKWYDTFCSR
jgi:TPR repeat protein